MLKALAAAFLLGVGLAGCANPAAERLELSAGATAPTPTRTGSVYMLRGIFGISGGIDEVAAELNALGVETAVYDHSDWFSIAETIKARYKARTEHEPVIVVGYSMGANQAIQLSRQLALDGIPVDLLLTLDPTIPPPVPTNVVRAVELYQTQAGFRGVPIEADPGFRGELVVRNFDDLPGIEHHNFPTRPEVRREIVARVLQIARPRAAGPKQHMVEQGWRQRG